MLTKHSTMPLLYGLAFFLPKIMVWKESRSGDMKPEKVKALWHAGLKLAATFHVSSFCKRGSEVNDHWHSAVLPRLSPLPYLAVIFSAHGWVDAPSC